MRAEPLCSQLDRQAIGKGRLSGGRRSCDHDKFLFPVFRDHLRQGPEFLFHQGFLGQDHVLQTSCHNRIVQIPDGGDPADLTPLSEFMQGGIKLFAWRKRPHFMLPFCRMHEHKAVFVRFD